MTTDARGGSPAEPIEPIEPGGREAPSEPERADAQAEPERADAQAEPERADAQAEPERADAQAEPERADAQAEPERAGAQAEPERAGERRGAGFWLSALVGWAIIGWGIRGALHHHIDTRPRELVGFFIGGALVHDLLFAPLVLVVGVLAARLVPGRWRAPFQAAFIISGSLALFAWPEIRDYARGLHNPTTLPYNYTANAASLIAVVWVVVLGGAAVARRIRPR